MPIPSKLKISRRITYEVLYCDDLGKDTLGECRFDKKQIVIKSGLSKEEELLTFIHEGFHALDHEHKLGLTHKVIYRLEKASLGIIKLNRWNK